MEIRQLTAQEYDVSLALAEYAFQYKLSPEEREKGRERFIPERIWGVFENGELLARLGLLPFQTYLHGKAFRMGGIGGVSTWPEKRRNGMVSGLLSRVLVHMKEQGCSLSFLHPFSISFYRKFGWEVLSDCKKYTISSEKFPAKTKVVGSVKRDVKDITLLDQIYQTFAQKYNGALVRDSSWWERGILNKEMYTAVYFSEAGEPEGYTFYNIKNRELLVEEFIFLNKTAHQALWNFLANHDSMVDQAVVNRAPADDILPFMLQDPRCKQEYIPNGMARIVDASAFVHEYPFQAPAAQVSININIADTFAPWNDGWWSLEVSTDGTGRLVKSEQGDSSSGLVCDINTLTAMLIGYKRPMEMFAIGRLHGSEAEVTVLEQLIPRSTTALFDFF